MNTVREELFPRTCWNEQFLELFRKNRREVAVSKELTGLEEMWGSKSRGNYERARALADQAIALLK